MSTLAVPLHRVLPRVSAVAARMRRCSGALRNWAGNELGHIGRPAALEIQTPTRGEADLSSTRIGLGIRTSVGNANLTLTAKQWPALASACATADVVRRNAIACMLVRPYLGQFANALIEVQLRHAPAPIGDMAGVIVHWGAKEIEVLDVDNGVLTAIEEHLSQIKLPLRPTTQNLRIPGRIFIESRTMELGTLQGLRELDIVLLPAKSANGVIVNHKNAFKLSVQFFVGNGASRSLQANATLHNSIMTLIETPRYQNENADEDASVGGGGKHPVQVVGGANRLASRLELNVQFELMGSPSLTVAEIDALTSGDILELQCPLEQAQVRIIVAQQKIGIGEIVVVGERLGIRITKIDFGNVGEILP